MLLQMKEKGEIKMEVVLLEDVKSWERRDKVVKVK